MRALLVMTAAMYAFPATAQDHSAHMGHAMPAQTAPADEAMPEPGDHAEHGQMDHSMMDHGAMPSDAEAPPVAGPPPRALEGPAHAADAIFGARAMALSRTQLAREAGGGTVGTLMVERLEARIGEGEELYLWDIQGWYGGDIDKLWVKSEGEGAFGGTVEKAEFQALWSHAIGPWFDLQAGARYDIEPQSRAHAVLGVQGLAPYMFEVDAAAFLSDTGDVTARIEAEYDQRITQRLIIQPRAEVSLSAQDMPSIGVGSGITAIETGLRLRYDILREFSPYVGIGYEAKLGKTADYARAAGESPDRLSLLIGLRTWF